MEEVIMEYVYSAMILHYLGKPINGANVKKVLEAAGAKVDEAKLKALVSSLENVNIDEAIKEASIQVAPVQQLVEDKKEKKEEKKEEKRAEEAAAGLSSLFGIIYY